MYKSDIIKTAHGFFGREGGVSLGIYDSLNCALSSKDAPENVTENRRRVATAIGVAPEMLVTLAQVHSNICIKIARSGDRASLEQSSCASQEASAEELKEPRSGDLVSPEQSPCASQEASVGELKEPRSGDLVSPEPSPSAKSEDFAGGNKIRQQADAMATNLQGVALGILTADCAPVLFHDAINGVIAAAHAGWKGALGGVIANTVTAMLELGAELENISASIGPCIQQDSYEVDDGFRQKFGEDKWFLPGVDKQHWQFDLSGFVESRLLLAGVRKIDNTGHDTYADQQRFFSFRRATHRKEADYGRQISAIALA